MQTLPGFAAAGVVYGFGVLAGMGAEWLYNNNDFVKGVVDEVGKKY